MLCELAVAGEERLPGLGVLGGGRGAARGRGGPGRGPVRPPVQLQAVCPRDTRQAVQGPCPSRHQEEPL